MNKSHSARLAGSRQHGASAFTLLELLVVISIIAVLAGILLPVTGSVMETARKTSAKNTVQQIVTAVKSYQTDYGVYPPPNPGLSTTTPATTDTVYLGPQNSALFDILRATDTVTTSPNTRRIVYFEGKDVKNSTTPKDGFATKQTSTTIGTNTFSVPIRTLVDPWGVGYMVRYDSGYDDMLVLPQTEGSTPSKDSAGLSGSDVTVLHFGVIAWSHGKDGQVGKGGNFGTAPNYTYGDDVVSWQ